MSSYFSLLSRPYKATDFGGDLLSSIDGPQPSSSRRGTCDTTAYRRLSCGSIEAQSWCHALFWVLTGQRPRTKTQLGGTGDAAVWHVVLLQP
jgi:hypothetical protein